MAENHENYAASLYSVDSPARQARFFAVLGATQEQVAEVAGVSIRQVQRWWHGEKALSLHEAFLIAEAFGNTRLIDAYQRDIRRISIPDPIAQSEERAGMEVYLLMEKSFADIIPFILKRLDGTPLTLDEEEQCTLLCDDVAGKLALLRLLLQGAQGVQEQQ